MNSEIKNKFVIYDSCKVTVKVITIVHASHDGKITIWSLHMEGAGSSTTVNKSQKGFMLGYNHLDRRLQPIWDSNSLDD